MAQFSIPHPTTFRSARSRGTLGSNLSIYTADGKHVQTILDGPVSHGHKTFEWNGRDENGNPVSSGVYFCRLTSGNRTLTQKMTLVK